MVASNRVTGRLWPISLVRAFALIPATLLLTSQLALAQFTQQGPKLVANDAVVASVPEQGRSVALSGNGNTAILGGPSDNDTGAAWIFNRSSGVWTQQGSKLVGSGAVGDANQGDAVALSGDGNTAIVGGAGDDNAIGAAWVYIRPVRRQADAEWRGKGQIRPLRPLSKARELL